MQLCSYLTFDGNCKQAMTFYHACFGGSLVLQTLADSPLAEKVSWKMSDVVVHATLSTQNLLLMGTDLVPESGLQKGNAVTLSLLCSTPEELIEYYGKLKHQSLEYSAITANFYGFHTATLTDKFGIHWLLQNT